jgi:hypothetical protein
MLFLPLLCLLAVPCMSCLCNLPAETSAKVQHSVFGADLTNKGTLGFTRAFLASTVPLWLAVPHHFSV